jgi:hypothetical protein
MKTNLIAVLLIGIGTGMITSAVFMRKEKAQAKTPDMSSMTEAERLRAELIFWLMMAPCRGYTPEQIATYYNQQVVFIELISKF